MTALIAFPFLRTCVLLTRFATYQSRILAPKSASRRVRLTRRLLAHPKIEPRPLVRFGSHLPMQHFAQRPHALANEQPLPEQIEQLPSGASIRASIVRLVELHPVASGGVL